MKEIIILCGIQGAGKSSYVKAYTDNGYIRFNRDNDNCSLEQLNITLEKSIKEGNEIFVLDNTYGTRLSRSFVISIGKRYGIPVKCVWLQTSIEDAQFNVAKRILDEYCFGKKKDNIFNRVVCSRINDLLGPNGNKLFKGIVPSIALYAYKKSFEEPKIDEGFYAIEKINFVRNPLPKEYVNRAIIFDYDGTLRETKSGAKYPKDPNDIVILPNRKEKIKECVENGYLLLGVSNQSGIEKGDLTEEMADKCFKKTNNLLGFNIDVVYCPHHSFPIRCFCRKPLSGLGVYLIEVYELNPSECYFIGDSTSDKTFAKRCGFKFIGQEEFFKK